MKRTLFIITCVLASVMMWAQGESNDYLPFVELGKQWHVVSNPTNPYVTCSLERYEMYKEEERDGKTYVQTYLLNDKLCTYREEGLFREENRRVYKYDEAAGRDIMLYDFSLKEGDTFTYEYGFPEPENFKVLKQGWLTDGPKIVTSRTLVSDTLDIKYRYLRTWTIGRDNGSGEYYEVATWVECIGAIENMFSSFESCGLKSCLAYVERRENQTNYQENAYLPFSLYNMYGPVYGCDLPTGAEEHAENGHHQLTCELEGDRLHVYGKVLTQCGPNNYAYFYERSTDDPSVHKIDFEIQEVEPTKDCMALHSTNFYVSGFDPNLNYIVVDNYGEEHPVINKASQMAYRPFIEDGKVWKVGGEVSDNLVQWVEYNYFDGDTIIDGRICKQMMRQLYVSPNHPDYAIISQSPSQSYVGAWYEEDKKVYEYDTTNKQFKLMYDFSLNAYDTLQIYNDFYVIESRQTGGIKGFKGVYRNVWECGVGESIIYRCAPWLEGVGGVYGPPTLNVFNVELADPIWFLMSCTVGDEVIYLNDEYEDGATPDVLEARKVRFDFTHTVKTQPKAPIKRETSDACISSSEREVVRPEVKAPRRKVAEKSLYGEYSAQQLDINLDMLDDTYQVRIIDASGKAVYEKTINAGNIVGLNIDISAYTEGCYTVSVENSQESFTGEFNANTTGVEEVRSKKEEVRSYIYNLQGQRLNTLQKGLNIVNGRKVYVK